jgi:hypothetical protein
MVARAPVGPQVFATVTAMTSDDLDTTRTWTPRLPADPTSVRIVLISECAAPEARDDYGGSPDSVFDATTLAAFAAGGLPVGSIDELAARGIHLTTAIRHPKRGPRITAGTVCDHAPVLADELAQLPGPVTYLLMGDVAIAAVNCIARQRTGRRAIPAGSTYRIRGGDYRLDGVRLLPSYLQAGPAWYIEASKRAMIAEDIATALATI